MSRTATQQGPGGDFATSRRGGLNATEIREIEAHRAKDRPTPWAALAQRYGRCETDIRSLFTPIEPPREERWPFGEASVAVQGVVREIAALHGVSLAQMSQPAGGGRFANMQVWKAQRASYVAARRVGRLTLMQLETVFRRDKGSITRSMDLHTKEERGPVHISKPLATVVDQIADASYQRLRFVAE